MAFYLYTTRENPQKLREDFQHLHNILEQKFDFFEFFSKEASDQKKQRVFVQRFLKLIEISRETSEILRVLHKNKRNLAFLHRFISTMLISFDEIPNKSLIKAYK